MFKGNTENRIAQASVARNNLYRFGLALKLYAKVMQAKQVGQLCVQLVVDVQIPCIIPFLYIYLWYILICALFA